MAVNAVDIVEKRGKIEKNSNITPNIA